MKLIQLIKEQRGFTLIEVLLVVAIIALLAGIVIIAVNPSRQLAKTNNTERRADVAEILDAVYEYALENNGTLPAGITSTPTEICATGVASADCTTDGFVELTELTNNETFIVSIPVDPDGGSTANGTGYEISTTANGRVIVAAPNAELGETISVTR